MILLPGYLDKELWEAFEEMRRHMKKPMTDYARKLVVYELQRMKEAGHDPNESLKQSVIHNWVDVYEPKEKQVTFKATAQTQQWLADMKDHKAKSQTPEAHEARRKAMERLGR